MSDKTDKKDVKVQDLAPKKDAKGGFASMNAASQNSASQNSFDPNASQNAASQNKFEQNTKGVDRPSVS